MRGQPRPELSADARQALRAHAWPGNVRELNNVIQRSLILLRSAELTSADLLLETRIEPEAELAAEPGHQLQDNLKAQEQQIIIDALAANHGNRKAVAETLGISPRTLRYKLARLREAGVSLPFVAGADSSIAAH